jgi:dipeptidyl aminopeptidase/acylaminoacyl peptidase
MMKRLLLMVSLLMLSACFVQAQQKHFMTADDLWAMKRIGDAELSPDGKTLVYVVTSYNMDKNKGNSDIWLVNSDGGNPRPLKNSEKQ